jgi:hypothetical protein
MKGEEMTSFGVNYICLLFWERTRFLSGPVVLL